MKTKNPSWLKIQNQNAHEFHFSVDRVLKKQMRVVLGKNPRTRKKGPCNNGLPSLDGIPAPIFENNEWQFHARNGPWDLLN